MTENLPARMNDIPTSLIDVAETLGMGVALKLMDALGGQEVLFPKAPRADHHILRELGEEDGRAVCAFLAGQTIYIPHGRERRSMRKDGRPAPAGPARHHP